MKALSANSMEQSCSWEVIVIQLVKIPHLLWSQKFITVFTKSLSLVLVLSQINPVHTLLHSLPKFSSDIIFWQCQHSTKLV